MSTVVASPENRPITLLGAYIQQKRANHWECAKMRQRLAIEQYLNGTMNANAKVHLVDIIGGKGGKRAIVLNYKFIGKPVKIDKKMGSIEMVRVDMDGAPLAGFTPIKVIFMQLDPHDGYVIPPRASFAVRTSARTSVARASAARTSVARASAARTSAARTSTAAENTPRKSSARASSKRVSTKANNSA